MREKILLSGDSNTSKTFSLVSLAISKPESNVALFDPDDGTAKVLEELGLSSEDVPNLNIIPVRADWRKLIEDYKAVKAVFGADDWVCFDMVGRFWDLAQQYYSEEVFGSDPIEHILTLKRQAKQTNFGGFDGLQDWSLIKRLHNEMIMDDAVLWSQFNVMCTTSVREYLPVEKVPKTGIASVYVKEFGVKPEGEKHNIYRFDTQAVMYRKVVDSQARYFFRLVRDRGRTINLAEEFDITGSNFWTKYAEYRGL